MGLLTISSFDSPSPTANASTNVPNRKKEAERSWRNRSKRLQLKHRLQKKQYQSVTIARLLAKERNEKAADAKLTARNPRLTKNESRALKGVNQLAYQLAQKTLKSASLMPNLMDPELIRDGNRDAHGTHIEGTAMQLLDSIRDKLESSSGGGLHELQKFQQERLGDFLNGFHALEDRAGSMLLYERIDADFEYLKGFYDEEDNHSSQILSILDNIKQSVLDSLATKEDKETDDYLQWLNSVADVVLSVVDASDAMSAQSLNQLLQNALPLPQRALNNFKSENVAIHDKLDKLDKSKTQQLKDALGTIERAVDLLASNKKADPEMVDRLREILKEKERLKSAEQSDQADAVQVQNNLQKPFEDLKEKSLPLETIRGA